jgi:hypothetical protein
MEIQEMEQLQLCDAPTVKKTVSGLNGSIAQVALAELRVSQDAKKALAALIAKFPNAKTSIKCIYWYASKAGIRLQKSAQEVKTTTILEQSKGLGEIKMPTLIKKSA